MYIVLKNWSFCGGYNLHMVRTPQGETKLLSDSQLRDYLKDKQWRYAS